MVMTIQGLMQHVDYADIPWQELSLPCLMDTQMVCMTEYIWIYIIYIYIYM